MLRRFLGRFGLVWGLLAVRRLVRTEKGESGEIYSANHV